MRGKYLNAMMLLLRNELWDEVISLLDRTSKEVNEAVSAQMFEAVLHSALQQKKTDYLRLIWPHIPPTMKALDLVHAVSCHIAGDQDSLPLDSKASFTVGMFRNVLLQLLDAESASF